VRAANRGSSPSKATRAWRHGDTLVAAGALGLAVAVHYASIALVAAAASLVARARHRVAIRRGADHVVGPPETGGSAAGVNETIVEASGALGVAVLGSAFAAGAGYAWPLVAAVWRRPRPRLSCRRVLTRGRPRSAIAGPPAGDAFGPSRVVGPRTRSGPARPQSNGRSLEPRYGHAVSLSSSASVDGRMPSRWRCR